MKTNPENIPDFLLDWLEKRPFQTLTNDEKSEVLRYFHQDEFEEIQRISISIKSTTQNYSIENSKARLLERFDDIHSKGKGKGGNLLLDFPVWKAAAIVLLLVCIGLIFRILNSPVGHSQEMASKLDTVYLVKEIAKAPIMIFDTVFISKIPQMPVKSRRINVNTINESDFVRETISAGEELAVVSIKELESTANQPKRNSLKDDSLLRKFAIVRL